MTGWVLMVDGADDDMAFDLLLGVVLGAEVTCVEYGRRHCRLSTSVQWVVGIAVGEMMNDDAKERAESI